MQLSHINKQLESDIKNGSQFPKLLFGDGNAVQLSSQEEGIPANKNHSHFLSGEPQTKDFFLRYMYKDSGKNKVNALHVRINGHYDAKF